MTVDEINKVETLIGYLEFFLKKRGYPSSADEIQAVVDEANEWINSEKLNPTTF